MNENGKKTDSVEIFRPILPVKYNFEETKQIAKLFIDSGLFKDVKDASQAIVKIMAGRELGLEPFQAMAGIDIILGNVSVKPYVIAGKIKQSVKYDYKIKELNNKGCVIDFFENDKLQGSFSYNEDDAKKEGLYNKKGSSYPRIPKDMYFCRALGKGARKYCSEINFMPVYVQGEQMIDYQEKEEEQISEEIKAEKLTDLIKPKIEECAENVQILVGAEQKKVWGKRPFKQDTLKEYLSHKIKKLDLNIQAEDNIQYAFEGRTETDVLKRCRMSLFRITIENEERRHWLTEYLIGKPSTKDFTAGEAIAMIDWVGLVKSEEGEWMPSDYAIEEASNLFNFYDFMKEEQKKQEIAKKELEQQKEVVNEEVKKEEKPQETLYYKEEKN